MVYLPLSTYIWLIFMVNVGKYFYHTSILWGFQVGKKKILERKPASPTCSQKGDDRIFGGETLRNVGVVGILFANMAFRSCVRSC